MPARGSGIRGEARVQEDLVDPDRHGASAHAVAVVCEVMWQ
jgi:hypothetical protein